VIASVTHDRDFTIADGRNAFQQEMRRIARVAQHDDFTDSWLPAGRKDEEPIPFPQRRLHAVAGNGHTPGTASHFFVA
jgi:hypothetical protein